MLGAFVLMFGVVVFSIIMNNLIEILQSFRAMEDQGQHKDLSKWIAMLAKYNNGNPMSKELITAIEQFFSYYWANNKMNAFASNIDKKFMDQLPETTVQQIYIDYVFQDYVYKFRHQFRYKSKVGQTIFLQREDPAFRPHLLKLLKELQPRQYLVGSNNMIQDQFQEVFEVLYIMKGKVGVGYRLFNEIFLGIALKERQVMNDYAIIQEKVSEFLYQPILENVEGLALNR